MNAAIFKRIASYLGAAGALLTAVYQLANGHYDLAFMSASAALGMLGVNLPTSQQVHLDKVVSGGDQPDDRS